ncbi:MAG TPA: DegT/DnrJ/EryC1/StrS family aminotransferase [Candidatus Eisenbacteria bacterium]|nr:DegT/DnrJ/EryC1/StrS family aminotransferase [Candidatus Eisenbacteria bacterium]
MSAQPTTQPTTQPTAQPTTPATKQTVPLLDLTAQFKSIESEIRGAIDRVVTSGRYIGGPEVSEFEKEVGAYCQVPHAIACASGTDALILAMRALGVGSGDEVITPAYSFLASASAVALVGGKPVFVDVEPDTYNIDPTKIERAITPRTKAVIVVHLFGQCADLEAVQAVCKRHRLPLVEDAAQAIGAEWKGRRAGSWGDIGCFSFFPSKNLGAFGDGGLVVSTQAALGDKLRLLREHGAKPKYNHIELGMNSRLDALQAAVLRVKLRHLESWTEGRRRNADLYRERLAGSGSGLPVARPDARHIYNQFVVRSTKRDALREHLTAAGVGTEIYYPKPMHVQPCFSALGNQEGDFPVSEAAARETVALPIYPELTRDQIAYVADRVKEFVASPS